MSTLSYYMQPILVLLFLTTNFISINHDQQQ